MTTENLTIKFTLNGVKKTVSVDKKTRLLDLLRDLSMFSVKCGCREGDCGMCTVLMNGSPIRSCMFPAYKADGENIETVEGLTPYGDDLHPIQQAFVETGAIQCGYCTPAQILSAKALLDSNPSPSIDEIKNAMHGVMCRCTGYVRIVEAVQRAADMMQGKKVAPIVRNEQLLQENASKISLPKAYYRKDGNTDPLPPLVLTPEGMETTEFIGNPEIKVDAIKLAQGKPVFTDDITLPGMLYGALLTSPYAHARIKNIDTTKAKALPGVHAVLTHKDVKRVKFASGGQSYPQPLPYDQVLLDDKVRHVGDRVAIVAAESQEIAEKALKLIKVEYEELPHVLDALDALKDGAPVIHDEKDSEGIYDAKRNTVFHIEAHVGDPDQEFKSADQVFTGEFRTPKQQHGQMEPHVCISYWDEDNRLVIRSSTQVPFHVRRIVAPLIDVPIKQIRVIKPRIGGGFGGKQEIILEDICSMLTKVTGKPVRIEYSRKQEFTSARSRHPQMINYKVAVKKDIVTAIELKLIGDTGAYGCHGLTVQMVGGFKGLTLYNAPNARFICDVVYTNTPPAGAYRGYGAMQCEFAIEVLMEEIAEKLGLDVIEFKKKNLLKLGEPMHMAKQLGEGREGFDQAMESSGFEHAIPIGIEAIDFYGKRKKYSTQKEGPVKHGIGMAAMFHGSGIAGLDMAAATLKMNDDGSFNLLMGATDLGTGSDTILAQIAAEVLNIPVSDFIVYSSDTDFTPFDKGAYASSTTYISGGAVRKAALDIRSQILEQAALMLGVEKPDSLEMKNRKVIAPNGSSVTFAEVGLNSLHQQNQHQIMATASHLSYQSPPPTATSYADVDVDTETGEIKVNRLLMVVDCGRVINPRTAGGQVEGGMAQALGFAHSEDTIFNEDGDIVNADLGNYRMYKINEMPLLDVIFVQTDEPTGPYGAKSVSELAMDGVAPALVSAVHNATGVWLHELPLTPERVWKAIQSSNMK